MVKRLDKILADYDKVRENATTLQELREAANTVVEKIQALPEQTATEQLVLALFRGLSN